MESTHSSAIDSGLPDHAKHMNLMAATAPESFNAQSESLPRTDWTATASDASTSSPVSNVLDGSRLRSGIPSGKARLRHCRIQSPST